MKRFAWILPLCLAMVVAMGCPCLAADEKPAAEPAAGAAAPAPPPPPVKFDAVGAPLPPMTVKTVDGGKVFELAKLGKPAMLMFVNSSCTSCRLELITFKGMASSMKDKILPFVVTVDFDPKNTVSRFPDLGQMEYILIDGSDFALANKLGFDFTPATVITDASGKQTFRKGGFSKGDEKAVFAEVQKVMK